ncbi:hypothetical protein L6452_36391 [Arctium lappa]|uniref:Uncharacterized protein n=1 Tax=Arctium lappa TaxID=4217 RepID=A0ACB8Y9Q7_ARCLA|nr:hypothetical protein L6452_36391 [Arctium lappa]
MALPLHPPSNRLPSPPSPFPLSPASNPPLHPPHALPLAVMSPPRAAVSSPTLPWRRSRRRIPHWWISP